jgi:hypothetical protein
MSTMMDFHHLPTPDPTWDYRNIWEICELSRRLEQVVADQETRSLAMDDRVEGYLKDIQGMVHGALQQLEVRAMARRYEGESADADAT